MEKLYQTVSNSIKMLIFHGNFRAQSSDQITPKTVKDHMGVHSVNQKGPHRSALQNAKGTI